MTLVEAPISAALPKLRSSGVELDHDHLGRLVDSSALIGDVQALRARMAQDGYLFLPGLLNRDEVLAARGTVCDRLAAAKAIDDVNHPRIDAVAMPGASAFMPELARGNAELMKVLYDGPMIGFFEQFLGEPVRHYDFTWFRSIPPGQGTRSHCDVVYMGRGETQRLFTVWTPIGDIDFVQGGLMVLGGSNNNVRLKQTYGTMDVDSYCENKSATRAWGKSWGTGGWLKGDPNQLRRSIVGPDGSWLTSEYRAGDALIFSVYTVHASLDNHSNRLRLSSDSRYQPASTPSDDRWIGANPSGHSKQSQRGRIC